MHRTINGDKQRLDVRIYSSENNDYIYLFADQYEEYDRWVNEEIKKGKWIIEKTEGFRDQNYLLNRMLKSKGTKYGDILYEIYLNEYPDSDQKVNVWKLWNGMEIIKGETYINPKKPWYKIIGSVISEISYSVMLQCRRCRHETQTEATSISSQCNFCK